MLRHVVITICFAAVLSAASASAVMAGEQRDHDGAVPWRIIGTDERATSSRCIGRAETPLCAVETLLACFEWGRPDLCRMVDDDEEQYAGIFSDPADPTKYLAYRVISERSVTPDQDVEIIIEQQEMSAGQVIGPATAPSSGFHLQRQTDGRWKVVGWGDLDR
ncbi:hypothetical protein [Telmatospirillum siberiense]|uniref:Uncharacterized protein n=1 Tax=Telmatospirillum siberiense TaxID=382514 RepID=A0A2N3PQ42_9PROT|nr:hypothetical protein [Telmatospirillum siberiense]PKU22521.1 hypothetical protein CWS72_20925 [Telmatospirillum siberiense]